MMEKLQMCRICLVENVHMYVVVNRSLHELYEKLTDIPFVTEDSRPILACFFCCAKLKQCYRLLRKCLEAEELFAKMMKEDYEHNPLINEHHQFCSGFSKCLIENISIVGDGQTESIAVKVELPAVCERLDVFKTKLIQDETKNECSRRHIFKQLDLGNVGNSCVDVADVPPHPHHSESESEDDVPLIELRTEVEDEEVSKKKRRARERPTVAKKSKVDRRRTKPGDATTAERTKIEKSDLKVIRTTQQRTSKPGSYFREPYKCDQRSFYRVKKTRTHIGEKLYKCDLCERSFIQKCKLTRHIRTHTGEKPYKCDVCKRRFNEKGNLTQHIRTHTSEKPYKCDVCQRSFCTKNILVNHIRTHTGEKPYKCDICQNSFIQKSALTSHIRIHTGEKPYKCDICQNSFIHKSALTSHIRIHTGEKPYKCDLCQYTFSHRSNLTRHVLMIHAGE